MAFSSATDSHWSIRPIFQDGNFPVGRARDRVTTLRDRIASGNSIVMSFGTALTESMDARWKDSIQNDHSIGKSLLPAV